MNKNQCRRTQNDEFEALSYIYLEQFQVVRQSAPYEFIIHCQPYRGNKHDYQINILFWYTQNYPQTPLRYQIEPISGVTRESINKMSSKIQEIIYESRNKPLVYDIVEETRNWMHEYLIDRKSLNSSEKQLMKIEQIFERPKFSAFTPVTVETFLAWKKQFDAKHKVEKKVIDPKVMKITGKQWFQGVHEEEQDSEEEDQEEDDQIIDQQNTQQQTINEDPSNQLFS